MAVVTRKFHRKVGQRRTFFRSLAYNLIMKGGIQTTVARAKSIRPMVERMLTIAKKNRLADLRLLIAKLDNKEPAMKLFYELAPKYKERKGGYLRVLKIDGSRRRDGAQMAKIEFV